ncbi:Lsr2 family protein [uncultured Jatrophihabitans sp.]|uniref:histone-like nucleoid-structuring protein Lsr2 n=1 Tax=uncultured Jatrophihabitans sp. TaxID=1610747 RepID=UPI0035CB223C
MARKVTQVVELTDDIDGGKADQTVSFTFNGTNYEIDLSKKNVSAFGKVIKPYVDHGRRVRANGRKPGATSRARSSASPARSRVDLPQIREWAKSNGYEVSDRGRIPGNVIEAYDAQ